MRIGFSVTLSVKTAVTRFAKDLFKNIKTGVAGWIFYIRETDDWFKRSVYS